VDYEKFTKIASGIQALVVATAVIIGGVWTLYTFGSLQQVEKAKTELEKMHRSLLERGILAITVQPSQIKRSETSKRYILVNVVIQNSGNRTEVIDWSKSGLRVTKVDAGRGGGLAYEQALKVEYSVPGQEVLSSSILPGQTRALPFLVPLQHPGLYHVAFEATVSAIETAIHMREHSDTGVTPERAVWQAATFFSVE